MPMGDELKEVLKWEVGKKSKVCFSMKYANVLPHTQLV